MRKGGSLQQLPHAFVPWSGGVRRHLANLSLGGWSNDIITWQCEIRREELVSLDSLHCGE